MRRNTPLRRTGIVTQTIPATAPDQQRTIRGAQRPEYAGPAYAPIAIFGSASALAFISFSARRYSTGITLRNFGR